MSTIGQLLLKYSPKGIEFVEHVIEPQKSFDTMIALKCVYEEEKQKRAEKEGSKQFKKSDDLKRKDEV